MRQEILSIGKILNFHGIKGEVKVGFTEGNEKVLSEVNEIYAEKNSKPIRLEIENLRFHKKFAIIKFKDINSIDEAVELKGSFLKLPKENLIKYLEEDEFYISDLVGLKVYDMEEECLGEVSGVMNIKQQDTLFIKTASGKERLLPFTKKFVPEVSLKQGRITVNPIEGLL